MAKVADVFSQNNVISVKVNPKIYSLDVVYSAAYSWTDKAYVLLEGDPRKEIIVKLILKDKGESKKAVLEFNQQLLTYAFYEKMANQNKKLREIYLQRVLISNDPSMWAPIPEKETNFEDFEAIAVPWEDMSKKIGDKKKKNGKK